MTISMDKKYRTRDGRDVRLLCVDGPGDKCVVGIETNNVEFWHPDGRISKNIEYPADLIEYHEPDIRTIWVNVYEGYAHGYPEENAAKNMVGIGCIAIAQPVTFEVKRA